MLFADNTCAEFTQALASRAAVPGGGSASALAGAVGMALGSMVGNLTVGKKKYAGVEADITAIMDKASALQTELLRLVDEDTVAFEPLSKAYIIPKDDPDRPQIMEDALRLACSVPMKIMSASARAIEFHNEFAKKGSVVAISDAGVGVALCKASLMGASLNVFINTKSMADKEYAARVETEADGLLGKYCAMADDIYDYVTARLRG